MFHLSQKIHYLFELLYNKRIRKQLGSVGEGSFILRPCLLQGGGLDRIYIGKNTRIQAHSVLESWATFGNQTFSPRLVIGNHCKIGEYCHITACNSIVIGDGLLTGRFVLISDNSHGDLRLSNRDIAPIQRPLMTKGGISIGNNVWIGDKVTILSGVHIGDNVIIGANSVVNKDIPSDSLAAGIPAIVIKHLAPKE